MASEPTEIAIGVYNGATWMECVHCLPGFNDEPVKVWFPASANTMRDQMDARSSEPERIPRENLIEDVKMISYLEEDRWAGSVAHVTQQLSRAGRTLGTLYEDIFFELIDMIKTRLVEGDPLYSELIDDLPVYLYITTPDSARADICQSQKAAAIRAGARDAQMVIETACRLATVFASPTMRDWEPINELKVSCLLFHPAPRVDDHRQLRVRK